MVASRPLHAFAFAALLIVASLAGCTDGCAPVEVPTQVALALVSEEVRTLPILASGATRIAGEDVPDAHGRMEFRVDVAHEGLDNASLAFTDITISGLSLAVEVDGAAVAVEILKIEGSSSWQRASENRWDGRAENGTHLVVWWSVDFDPARDPLSLALPEGEAYAATVEFDWSHRDCYARASGHHVESFSDFVQASVNAQTFEPVGAPSLEVTGSGVGLVSEYRVKSGLNASIVSVEARAVRFGPPPLDAGANTSANGTLDGSGGALEITGEVELGPLAVSLVTFPRLAAFEGAQRVDEVSPAGPFAVRSTGAAGDSYEPSGVMLPAPFPPGPAVYVVTIRITYAPSDPTLGTTTDVFAAPVVVA